MYPKVKAAMSHDVEQMRRKSDFMELDERADSTEAGYDGE